MCRKLGVFGSVYSSKINVQAVDMGAVSKEIFSLWI
jgi:hypothetical protein